MILRQLIKWKNVNNLMLSFRWALVLTLVLSTLPTVSYAQSLGGVDLKSVKVDDLSDEQIRNYIKQAEEQGLNQSQLEALARQRGVSESEIAKLRRRIAELGDLESGNEIGTEKSGTSRSTTNGADYDPFGMLVGEERQMLSVEEQKIFGFDLFQKQSLTFAPNLNLPTPVNYELGPTDVLIVDLWGATQQYLELEIGPEGTIRPENMGPIYVNGLTIEEASKRIIERLSEINSGLKSNGDSPPTIFHQVSLGNIRSINVSVVGNVAQPSMYALPSLATVYTAIHAAGGPTENGTFRDIRLVRDNKLISTIDIYSFLTDGIRSGDERLKEGDVIIVRPYKAQIELDGEVNRPGLFELKEGEGFDDLLKYAGGFSSAAFKATVTVKRNGEKEREILDVDTDDFLSFSPQDGDFIKVSAILDRFSNRVIIEGAVNREGEYQLTENLTIKELIQKAGGLRGDAFLNRATIYRTNEDLSQSIIPIDLALVMNDSTPDLSLFKEDVVRITSIYDVTEEFIVTITGEVIEGGVLPFFNQMTVQDLIILAGGLKQSASGAFIEISRRNRNGSANSIAEIFTLSIDENLSLKSENQDFILQPFDQVYIRRSPGYTIQRQITLEGEVSSPGMYTVERKDERISDVIRRAQGLTSYAYAKGAILIRKTEFSNRKSNNEINLEYLKQLRDRVLDNDSELVSLSQKNLIDRLDKIERRLIKESNVDEIGSQVKKELIEGLLKQDSLISEFELFEQEPVALDLQSILDNPGSKFDFILRDGDVISIPAKLETVRVTGEVTSTLNLRYDETFKFKDYINDAGGFTVKAKKGRSYVQYPNGKMSAMRRFLFFKKYPKIEPGSTIFVSRKPERQGISAQAWIGISSGLATLGLVVLQAIRP